MILLELLFHSLCYSLMHVRLLHIFYWIPNTEYFRFRLN